MKLKYIKVNKDYRNNSKLKHLYEHAFPPIERPPFKILANFKNNELYAVEYNSTFIGLVDLVIYQDLVYLFFLAIKKTYRHKGYGTKILKYISEKYSSYRIFLMAEEPDIECDNKLERINRIKFYESNGFKVSNTHVIEYGVEYRILNRYKEASKEEFLKIMKYLIGESYYNKYYIKNVK